MGYIQWHLLKAEGVSTAQKIFYALQLRSGQGKNKQECVKPTSAVKSPTQPTSTSVHTSPSLTDQDHHPDFGEGNRWMHYYSCVTFHKDSGWRVVSCSCWLTECQTSIKWLSGESCSALIGCKPATSLTSDVWLVVCRVASTHHICLPGTHKYTFPCYSPHMPLWGAQGNLNNLLSH